MFNNLFVFTRRPLWWCRGDGAYRFAGPGAALLHRAGGEVQRRDVAMSGDFTDWFGVRTDVFEETLDRHGLYRTDITDKPVALVTDPPFRLMENQLIASLQQKPPATLAVEETALALFDRVCAGLSANVHQAPANARTRVRHQRLADRARAFLDSPESGCGNQDSAVPLSEIAGRLGTSVYHLCRVFRDECGMTMHAYRQRQRLGRAIELMQTSRQDLTRLALDLGYSSHSHFSRVFLQKTGLQPSACNYILS